MFYILSKTAGYLLTPAGWLLALLLSAWLWPRYRRRLVGTSLALFYLLGNSFVVYHQLARLWEAPLLQSPPGHVPGGSPAVAVVLTGGTINTSLRVSPARPMLGYQADRLEQALYLYKTGQVRKILISGGEGDLFFQRKDHVREGAAALDFLRLAGVPEQDLRWETQSRNTHENALFSAQQLRRYYQTDRCVVITSAFHMRRAQACFARQGIAATPFAAAYLQQSGKPALADLLVPHEQTFADAMYLLREMVGYVTYAVAGYV